MSKTIIMLILFISISITSFNQHGMLNMQNTDDIEHSASPRAELLNNKTQHENIDQENPNTKTTQTPKWGNPLLKQELDSLKSSLEKMEKVDHARQRDRCCEGTLLLSCVGCVCLILGTGIGAGVCFVLS